MSEGEPLASYFLEQARIALNKNDRSQARQWAVQAARQDAALEEPWLILAALSGPQASLIFLRRALEVNPASRRARQGMHWAIQRQRAERLLRANELAQPTLAATGRAERTVPAAALSGALAVTIPLTRRRPAARRAPLVSLLPLLAMALLFVAGLAGWAGSYGSRVVFAQNSFAERPAGALFKPSLTPTLTATATATSPPTQTPTPTATATDTPTSTPSNPPTPVPTGTPEPVQQAPQELPVEIPPGAEGDRWIEVNLSAQSLSAYEGGALVNTFLISSGTWEHPTVTGQYNIYVKYRYSDMSGPGYYLPNVPYVMYFYKGYGLHGTYWHSNFGTPMSHGCINLSTSDAAWLFDWAAVGTRIDIHN